MQKASPKYWHLYASLPGLTTHMTYTRHNYQHLRVPIVILQLFYEKKKLQTTEKSDSLELTGFAG